MTEQLPTIAALQARLRGWRREGLRIAFVPTMGNLHYGHLTLIEAAHQAGDRVVVSIFVNPTQFGPDEDFLSYPSTPEADLAKLEEMGVDVLFAPSVDEMYPDGHRIGTIVQVPELSDILCGAFRPGHFAGVATVVNKLFNIVGPDVAVFGQKDYQQLAVIRRMVRELSMPVEILGAPIAREPDGLAMSSRNVYLTPDERARAAVLNRTLLAARDAIAAGEPLDAVEGRSLRDLKEAGFRADYFSARRASDLHPPEADDRALVIVAAAWLGRARLLDNLEVERPLA